VELFEDLLNLLLPSNCVICNVSGSNLCEICHENLKLKSRKVSRLAISGFATSEYSAETAKLISEFKESHQTSIASVMATAMFDALVNFDLQNCVLVPIPSKRESFATRGFEPAALLSNALARRVAKNRNLLLPVVKALSYNSAVSDQASLNGKDRRTNLIGSMTATKASSRLASAAKVILIDDIVTTGASLTEAKRCLENIGVEVIGFVAFAETLPRNLQKLHAKAE
jgi:ComF family protein